MPARLAPFHRLPLTRLGALALVALIPSALSAQQITLEELVTIRGAIDSVSPGSIVVVDETGARHELQIAEPGEAGLPLKKAGLLVRFPAKVRVVGEYGADAIDRGSLVRFQTHVNRAGQSRGAVRELELLEDADLSTGIIESGTAAADPNAEKPNRDYVAVTVTGTVVRATGDRVTVLVGANDITHRDRLAATLAEDVHVRMESSDYRRAERGDLVVSLKAARFDSGDWAVQQIEIEKQAASGPSKEADADAALAAKYRHLPDEPGPIRDERSRHFLLHTDVSPQSAAILLEKLETMIGLVSGYYGRPPAQLIECYVVRDLSQWPLTVFDATASESIRSGAGVTLSRGLGRQVKAIVYACADHGTVQHEAVHAYCSQTFGDVGPVWYAEGMAEMGNYWRPDEPAVSIPAAAVHYLRTSPPKTMAEIVAAGQITGDSWEAYQWRWALCYLLANNPNYAPHFKGLGIGFMTDAGVSFETVYGRVAPQIAFEYEQFLKNLDNGYRVDLCAWQWNGPWSLLATSRRAAAKIEAARGWQATGVTVEMGASYDFVAKGEWHVHPDRPPTTADGSEDGAGRLIAVVMHDDHLSEPFELSIRGTFAAPETGNLYVRCRESWNRLGDNEGQITLHLRRSMVD